MGALIDGLKRTAGADEVALPPEEAYAGRLRPVWLLGHGLTSEELALIELRASGRLAAQRKLGPSDPVLLGARAVLRLEPDIGPISCFSPLQDRELRLDAAELGAGGVLLRPSHGRMEIERDGQRTVVSAREAIFLAGGAPAGLWLRHVDRVDCLVLANERITENMLECSASLRVFAQNNDTLVLLGNYGAALMRGLLPMSGPVLLQHACAYMGDLVDILCGEAESQAPHTVQDRAATRLNAIKSDIEAHLDDQGLNASQIALRHGISTRYLQKLFEGEGETFSEFVLQRRLDRAMRRLQSPDERKRSISEIAFDVGFGDLSYFNRTFRRRFDTSPRLVRAKHRSVPAGSARSEAPDAGSA
ncbi:helix-turn-helix transcriptional regulator [Labrys okinawensis]|uniref:helix-turn-helix transcriptional regulator n=1 Tax=Labrys okinawensis TaxID=346911 RepID=UPI0011B21466|nr:AraC family transcriptional regulator [Labrys okinawensis]